MSETLRPLIVWGGSGQALVLAEFAAAAGFRIVVLIDKSVEHSPLPGIPLHRGREGFEIWLATRPDGPIWGIAAIGGARGNDRLEIQQLFESRQIQPATIVHPTAFVASTASIARGTQVLAQASVCAAAKLGLACIVNTQANVDHECVLGDGVHVGPAACLAGCVEIGRNSFVGAGAVVLPRIKIGRDVVVGAGAVVTKDLPDGVVAYGNPARIARDRTETSQ